MQRECTNFEKFVEYIRQTLDDTKMDMLSADEPLLGNSRATKCQELARNISIAIQKLRSNYERKYDDILISIVVYPFLSGSYDNVLTLKPISMDDLKKLHDHFSDQRKKFVEYSDKKIPQQLQAFLFRAALDVCPHCKKWGVRVTPFWGVKQSCTTDTYFWCQNLDTPDGCYEDTHGVLRQHHFVVLR